MPLQVETTESHADEFFARNLGILGCGNSEDATFQIVKEFTDNAIDAVNRKYGSREEKMENSAQISVEVKCLKNGVIGIAVQDTGVGIQVNDLEDLMGKLFASSKGKGGEGGTFGLGVKAAVLYSKKCGLPGHLNITTSTMKDPKIHQVVLSMEGCRSSAIIHHEPSQKNISFSGTEVSILIIGNFEKSCSRLKSYFEGLFLQALNINISFVAKDVDAKKELASWDSQTSRKNSLLWSTIWLQKKVKEKFEVQSDTLIGSFTSKREGAGEVTCVVTATLRDPTVKEAGQALLSVFRYANNTVLYPSTSGCDILKGIREYSFWDKFGITFSGNPVQSRQDASTIFRIKHTAEIDFDLVLIVHISKCKAQYSSLTKCGLKLCNTLKIGLKRAIKSCFQQIRASNPNCFMSKDRKMELSSLQAVQRISKSIERIYKNCVDNKGCSSKFPAKLLKLLSLKAENVEGMMAIKLQENISHSIFARRKKKKRPWKQNDTSGTNNELKAVQPSDNISYHATLQRQPYALARQSANSDEKEAESRPSQLLLREVQNDTINEADFENLEACDSDAESFF